MNESVISVVLLPTEQDGEQLIELSNKINESAESLIKLGENFLPHITLVQFKAPPEETKNLWAEVQNLKRNVTSITSAGLSFVPDSRSDLMWVELSFLKSDLLRELQAEILGTAFAQKFGQNRGIADEYRPHCTLALLKNRTIPQLNIEGLRALKKNYESLTLAVGINGEHFTFTQAQYPRP